MTMKEYKHLNLVQRSEISALKASEKKQKYIAAYIDPYCSWKRGLSEHTSGLVRQYILKKLILKMLQTKR